MKKIKRLLENIYEFSFHGTNKIRHYHHLKNLAADPRHNDLYLVSFPKSGNTWLDFLVASINIGMCDSKKYVTFYNVHDFVPDIHDSSLIGEPGLPFPGFRIIKSHSEFNPYYKKVIYLIRDPHDTLISYYNFFKSLNHYSGSFSDFIKSTDFGIHAWVRHIQGWFINSPASLSFQYVTYESLTQDPGKEMARLYKQLGFTVPNEVISTAIEKSQFSAMKGWEMELNYGGRPSYKDFNFMRQGRVGYGALETSNEDRDYIKLHSKRILEKLGLYD